MCTLDIGHACNLTWLNISRTKPDRQLSFLFYNCEQPTISQLQFNNNNNNNNNNN